MLDFNTPDHIPGDMDYSHQLSQSYPSTVYIVEEKSYCKIITRYQLRHPFRKTQRLRPSLVH